MDKLIEKIIKKTELKNWTLFLFIFAISFTIGLRLLTKEWFHLPDEKFNQTTLFLLEVFLSSLTITRFLVAIKFLEAINRTPIIADIINWVVVERVKVRGHYAFLIEEVITGNVEGEEIDYWLQYKDGINEKEACLLIHYNIIVEGDLPDYKICKKAVINKSVGDCSNEKLTIKERVTFTLNPTLYRHFDREKYGFWLIGKFNKKGKWKKGRPLCLEHFLTVAFILGSAYITGMLIRLFLLN
jgi:hypothetical protein